MNAGPGRRLAGWDIGAAACSRFQRDQSWKEDNND